MVIISEEDHLAHYGILRRSGRYPWGSGRNQDTRNRTFLQTVEDLARKGLTQKDIAQGFDLSTTQLRDLKSIAKNQQKMSQIAMAERLKAKGTSNGAIAERMGLPGESSVRALLAPGAKEKAEVITNIANRLKKEVSEKKYLDIGTGVETNLSADMQLGISKEKLGVAVTLLEEQGYRKHSVKIPQAGTGKDTDTKVLVSPGVSQREAWENRDKIRSPTSFSPDGGRRFGEIHPPISVDPNRVSVLYNKDGGGKADGVIYIRPGVEDLSLGDSRYSQVRILVNGTHYIKGMAMYKDNLPAGTDLLFHTSKDSTGDKLDAFKPITADPDYPFGSIVRQIIHDPGGPDEHVTSAMNIVHEEGDWKKWNKNLSSQFLSKQSPALARSQLNLTYERRKQEFDTIMNLTNPTVRRKLLDEFAKESDSASVHLKAAQMPRQNWHAILPIDSLKPNEVYAPNYDNGEHVVLIRYPHGGTFEIPELTVNNNHPEAKKLIGVNPDVIGIHHEVARRLSGADFDGDTVLVIPNKSRRIRHTPALDKLMDFDPRSEYRGYEGMKVMGNKQQEMGNISNLITDMTLQSAPPEEIVRAIRHSMVVIDAENHKLDYKRSAVDNGIADLKKKYQGGPRAGAHTLISQKKSIEFIPERKPRPYSQGGPIDPLTGRLMFVPTNRTRLNKAGERVIKKERVKKLAEAQNAEELVSSARTPMEELYAEHSNKLKALANQARVEAFNTPRLKYSESAKKIYSHEVASLDSKLALVKMQRPKEREAQRISSANVKLIKQANPHLDKASIKKLEFRELEKARARVGARKADVKITQDEWDAIQLGAISDFKLSQILNKADLEVVKELATPKRKVKMSEHNVNRAKAMFASGATRAEVAKALGVSLTTLDLAIQGSKQ